MKLRYYSKIAFIFVLSICVNIYNINCGCCCNSCKGNKSNGNGGDIKKIIIKVTNSSITIDGNNLKKLEENNISTNLIHNNYSHDTNIYNVDGVDFNNNYAIVIEDNIKNKPYIIAIVEVLNDNEKLEHYIVSCLDNVGPNFFENCCEIKKVAILESKNVEDMSNMFNECSSLEKLDLNNFNTSKVTNMENMFSNCSSLTNLDLSNFDTSNVTNMKNMFFNCSSLTTINLSSLDTRNLTNMSNMFFGCSTLTAVNLNNINTNNVTEMSCMFYGCSSLTNINLSNFNTNNVTDMSGMFYECLSLTNINLSNFNTNKKTSIIYMFDKCSSLKKENIITKDKRILNQLADNNDE